MLRINNPEQTQILNAAKNLVALRVSQKELYKKLLGDATKIENGEKYIFDNQAGGTTEMIVTFSGENGYQVQVIDKDPKVPEWRDKTKTRDITLSTGADQTDDKVHVSGTFEDFYFGDRTSVKKFEIDKIFEISQTPLITLLSNRMTDIANTPRKD